MQQAQKTDQSQTGGDIPKRFFQTNGMPFDKEFTFTEKQEWKEHDLRTYDVRFGRHDAGLQAIVYKGNFICFRSKNYKVYPHEELFTEIDTVLESMGAKILPRNKSDGFTMKYGKNQQAQLEANYKIYNGKKVYVASSVRANYLFDDGKFDVTGDGDVVDFGVGIENTIDGTGSMKIYPYSNRQVCSNGMMHNSTVVEISETILQKLLSKQQNAPLIQNQARKIMDHSAEFDSLINRMKKERMTHLTTIPIEWIQSRVYLVRETVELFKSKYRDMTKLLTTQAQAEALVKSMPKRLIDKMEWLEVKLDDAERKATDGSVINFKIPKVTLKGNILQWKSFNAVTEDLTHNERAFNSVSKHYKALDKIMVSVK